MALLTPTSADTLHAEAGPPAGGGGGGGGGGALALVRHAVADEAHMLTLSGLTPGVDVADVAAEPISGARALYVYWGPNPAALGSWQKLPAYDADLAGAAADAEASEAARAESAEGGLTAAVALRALGTDLSTEAGSRAAGDTTTLAAAGAAATADGQGRQFQIFGATRRTLHPELDELAAVAFGNIDSFVSWLTQGGNALGCIGEVGIPAQPIATDVFSTYVAELIATTRGSGPHNIATGRWAGLLEAVLRYADDVVTPLQPQGLSVLGWEARETTLSGLNMFAPDPVTYGANVAAPIGITMPAGRVLIEHINRLQVIGSDPLKGVAVSAGVDGFTDTSALTRGADTTPFSVASPGPALGASYCYGRPETFQFLSKLGVRFARLLFRGERLFDDNAQLRPVELGRLDDAIAAAKAAGMFVILDWHSGGSRYFDNGLGDGGLVRRSLGMADGTGPQPKVFDTTFFSACWGKLVSHLVTPLGAADPNNPGITGRGDLKAAVVGYELMNEPAMYLAGSTNAIQTPDMTGRNAWQNASIGAAWTIRPLDANTKIYGQAYGGGSAASSFWTYHTGAGGAPNHWITLPASMGGGTDPNVVYAMHTYFDSTGGGSYPDSYEVTRQARAAQGFVAKPTARPVGGLMVPHGGFWPRTMVTGQGGVPALGNNVLTADVYKCPLGKVALISDLMVTGPAGTTRCFARPLGTVNAAAITAGWEAKRISNAAAPGFKPGPIYLGPDDRLDVLASVAGVALSFTVTELPTDGHLRVVSGLALPAGDQRLLQNLVTIPSSPPQPTKIRVCNSGAFFHPMGFGWCAFNGAAVAANVQGKIKKAGGAVTACGPTLQTAATAHSIGPGNATPGVPSNLVEVVLDPSDELWINSDQAGLNVWLLVQELA